VNRRWVEYTGDSADGGDGSWRALHREDSQRMPDTWTALRRAEGPGDFEARLKRLDGVFRWFLFHAEPHRGPDGGVGGLVRNSHGYMRIESERNRYMPRRCARCK